MLKIKTLFALGKGISTFASILLVSFLLLACNNLTIGGGSLIISTPGARAATASSFTIELTGSNGATQNKPVSGGSTIQFDDLAPDTYTISVKGMDDAGTVVFSGSAKATVVAGKTATVTVDLQELLGSLTVEFTVPAESTATSFTVEVSDSKDFSESKPVSDGTSVLFNDLIPGSYTISVQGMNAGTVVVSGSATTDVVAGETAPVTVALELSLGSLTVNFEGAESVSVVKYNVTLSGPNEFEEPREVESKSVQFDDLAPDTYNIVVEGIDTNNKVVVGGAYSATVTAGASASALVNLVEGVSDFAGLEEAVAAGNTVYVLKSIDVEKTLSISNTVTIVPAYQDVTLKNTGSGNLFTVANSAGNLTIGGGEYTITLDGNQVAQSIISMSGGTATLADNGIITNAAASGINISSATFTMSGGILKDNKSSGTGGAIAMISGTCTITGGSITGNTAQNYGGGVCVSGGTFNLSGGSISNNSATYGSGVSVNQGSFKMSGSAVVAPDNDVYLLSGKMITVAGTLSGATPVATITPNTTDGYTAGTLVMSVENNVVLADEVSKFAVTQNPADGKQWTIDTSGKLQQQ